MEFNEWSSSYYSILGVDENSSDEEIRRAYRKLAMQWHPDKWTRTPSLLGEAKKKFQQIQEAYSVLSDQKKRMMYDAGLYNPDEDEDEGFADFLQEMATLMSDTRKEVKNYSMEDLQNMLWEMAESFDTSTCNWSSFSQQQNYELPQFFCSPFAYDDSTLRTGQMDSNFTGRNPFFDFSNMEMHRFCRSTTYKWPPYEDCGSQCFCILGCCWNLEPVEHSNTQRKYDHFNMYRLVLVFVFANYYIVECSHTRTGYTRTGYTYQNWIYQLVMSAFGESSIAGVAAAAKAHPSFLILLAALFWTRNNS